MPSSDPPAPSAFALYESARLLMEAGRLHEAAETFRSSIALAPHFKALELLGECLLALGTPLAAIPPLAAATALNPGVRAPSLLAQAFLAAGEFQDAERFARQVLATASSNRRAKAVLESLNASRSGTAR